MIKNIEVLDFNLVSLENLLVLPSGTEKKLWIYESIIIFA